MKPDTRKPATIIAELKRQKKDLIATANNALRDLQFSHREREQYRARASKAEQECAEWKRRFDQLLAREPITNAVGKPVEGLKEAAQRAGQEVPRG